MLRVQKSIAAAQDELAAHPFMARLERSHATLGQARTLVADLTYWVMSFQDVVRLNCERVTSPIYRRFAEQHRDEDTGHEQWFWLDSQELGISPPLAWFFGPDTAPVRGASLEIASEVYRASGDEARISLILALEAAGAVFFPRIIRYFDHVGVERKLRYFARLHHEVEQSHDLHIGETVAVLEQMQLSNLQHEECLGVVARVFAVFRRLADFCEGRITSGASAANHPRHM